MEKPTDDTMPEGPQFMSVGLSFIGHCNAIKRQRCNVHSFWWWLKKGLNSRRTRARLCFRLLLARPRTFNRIVPLPPPRDVIIENVDAEKRWAPNERPKEMTKEEIDTTTDHFEISVTDSPIASRVTKRRDQIWSNGEEESLPSTIFDHFHFECRRHACVCVR